MAHQAQAVSFPPLINNDVISAKKFEFDTFRKLALHRENRTENMETTL
jgi:hypothetical protein